MNESVDEDDKDEEQSQPHDKAYHMATECRKMLSNEDETVEKSDTTLPERRNEDSVEGSSS